MRTLELWIVLAYFAFLLLKRNSHLGAALSTTGCTLILVLHYRDRGFYSYAGHDTVSSLLFVCGTVLLIAGCAFLIWQTYARRRRIA